MYTYRESLPQMRKYGGGGGRKYFEGDISIGSQLHEGGEIVVYNYYMLFNAYSGVLYEIFAILFRARNTLER